MNSINRFVSTSANISPQTPETQIASDQTNPPIANSPGPNVPDVFQTFEQPSLDLNTLTEIATKKSELFTPEVKNETVEASSLFEIMNTSTRPEYPGVNLQEVPNSSRIIPGVDTSDAKNLEIKDLEPEVLTDDVTNSINRETNRDWSTMKDKLHSVEERLAENLDPEYADYKKYVERTRKENAAISGMQNAFKNQFGSLAADEQKFHSVFSAIYGADGYYYEAAEELRQMALNGDYSWLPKIEFISDKSLQGKDQHGQIYNPNGVYVFSEGTVYLSDRLLNDPVEAAKSFTRAAGQYFSDRMLQKPPSIGETIGSWAGSGPNTTAPDYGLSGYERELFRTALAEEPYDPNYFAPEVKVYFSIGSRGISGYHPTV